ncbi:hypothetical protein IQ250_04055 [Pseudanabaenaceae cyanobacterium LEGE 13415]|nr:hypothetical protein [Pseudanabaenaceae cyanobacterium LEGE 13415]
MWLREIYHLVRLFRSAISTHLTGDIANAGQAGQYDKFNEELLAPLLELIGHEQVYRVPGNHAVDRYKNATV